VAQGIEAVRAGAAILHLHARNPDGSNTGNLEIYREIHDRLGQETDAVLQLTTGGSPVLTVEERFHTVELDPEMCSLNMGLLNFIVGGTEMFFANNRSDIRRYATEIASRGIRPELEVYNSAMLEEVDHLLTLGILAPPYVINIALHTPTQGGQRGTPQNLMDIVSRIGELGVPSDELRVNVTAIGDAELPLSTIALAMGLDVRVGMEDNIFYRPGELVRSNAQLVERAARIAAELGRAVSTPGEVREHLKLRGRAGALTSDRASQ
jgi:3-keto-5-aminohexanoate cleavage enzyme